MNLQQFNEALQDIFNDPQWMRDMSTPIRFQREGDIYDYCPLSAVFLHKTGARMPNTYYHIIAKALDIAPVIARGIVILSDASEASVCKLLSWTPSDHDNPNG